MLIFGGLVHGTVFVGRLLVEAAFGGDLLGEFVPLGLMRETLFLSLPREALLFGGFIDQAIFLGPVLSKS
jgi:hypothetical protein